MTTLFDLIGSGPSDMPGPAAWHRGNCYLLSDRLRPPDGTACSTYQPAVGGYLVIIAVDGVYSAGKSTLLSALSDRLETLAAGRLGVTEWNSSELLGARIPEWKRDGRLGAHSLLMVEAADLAHRCEQTIRAHLVSGGVLIADRWVLSGIARSVIRERTFAHRVFDFAPREVVTVLIDPADRAAIAGRLSFSDRSTSCPCLRFYTSLSSFEVT
jgi:hypothetical protein